VEPNIEQQNSAAGGVLPFSVVDTPLSAATIFCTNKQLLGD